MSDDEGDGLPPGDENTEVYEATSFVRGGGRSGGGFFWFACADRARDRVLQLANLRDFEPGDITGPRAIFHFSGMDVWLEGSGMRQVAWRIFLGRCTGAHEIRPGQKPKTPEEPIIRNIRFLVPPTLNNDKKISKPRDEPEVTRAKG